MNCHKDNKEKENTQKHSPLKHILHMIICCGLPIVVIALLPVIAKFSPSTGNVIGKIAPFLCPLMMIFMMPMMMGHGKKGSCCDNKKSDTNSKEII